MTFDLFTKLRIIIYIKAKALQESFLRRFFFLFLILILFLSLSHTGTAYRHTAGGRYMVTCGNRDCEKQDPFLKRKSCGQRGPGACASGPFVVVRSAFAYREGPSTLQEHFASGEGPSFLQEHFASGEGPSPLQEHFCIMRK